VWWVAYLHHKGYNLFPFCDYCFKFIPRIYLVKGSMVFGLFFLTKWNDFSMFSIQLARLLGHNLHTRILSLQILSLRIWNLFPHTFASFLVQLDTWKIGLRSCTMWVSHVSFQFFRSLNFIVRL
jgi:hypothetical protein